MIEQHGDGVRATAHAAGRPERRDGSRVDGRPAAPGWRPRRSSDCSSETAEFWRAWVHKSTYTGRWREMVSRSAMTLKMMIYTPTGAPVAAPTTGLPEQVGGERNWDYRYTWIRDGSFSLYALLGLGYVEEARAFAGWLRAPRRRAQAGQRPPAEDHVPGRRKLRPDRGDPRPLRGLARLAAGAGRQRRGRPAAARHLRRDARRRVPGRRQRPAGVSPRAGSRCRGWSTGCATTGTSPTRASGRPAAGSGTSPTAGSRAGWRSTGPSG